MRFAEHPFIFASENAHLVQAEEIPYITIQYYHRLAIGLERV